MNSMLFHKQAEFASGSVLTKEMLELLETYPKKFLQLYFESYCEGVLCGLDYKIQEGDLWLTPGILWWQKKIWTSSTAINISAFLRKCHLEEGTLGIVQWRPEQEITQKGVTVHRLSLDIQYNLTKESPLEVGRFLWRDHRSIKVPNNWDELIESTERGYYFNICHAFQAFPGHATFVQLIFKYMKEVLRQKEGHTPLESAILVQLQNQGRVSLDTLYTYIGRNTAIGSCDNKLPLEELLQAVNEQLHRKHKISDQVVTSSEDIDETMQDGDDMQIEPQGYMID